MIYQISLAEDGGVTFCALIISSPLWLLQLCSWQTYVLFGCMYGALSIRHTVVGIHNIRHALLLFLDVV